MSQVVEADVWKVRLRKQRFEGAGNKFLAAHGDDNPSRKHQPVVFPQPRQLHPLLELGFAMSPQGTLRELRQFNGPRNRPLHKPIPTRKLLRCRLGKRNRAGVLYRTLASSCVMICNMRNNRSGKGEEGDGLMSRSRRYRRMRWWVWRHLWRLEPYGTE